MAAQGHMITRGEVQAGILRQLPTRIAVFGDAMWLETNVNRRNDVQ